MEKMPKPNTKPPSGFKEWTGWLIRHIGCPIVGAIIAYSIMGDVDWPLTIRIVVGVFVVFPLLCEVSYWVLAPIWNSLYVPTPDLPEDEGVIESNIYKNSNGEMYLRGQGYDIISYEEEHNNTKLALAHMNSDEKALLDKVDVVVKLHYKFIKYRDGFVKIGYFRRDPRLTYKWPVYEYKIVCTGSKA